MQSVPLEYTTISLRWRSITSGLFDGNTGSVSTYYVRWKCVFWHLPRNWTFCRRNCGTHCPTWMQPMRLVWPTISIRWRRNYVGCLWWEYWKRFDILMCERICDENVYFELGHLPRNCALPSGISSIRRNHGTRYLNRLRLGCTTISIRWRGNYLGKCGRRGAGQYLSLLLARQRGRVLSFQSE